MKWLALDLIYFVSFVTGGIRQNRKKIQIFFQCRISMKLFLKHIIFAYIPSLISMIFCSEWLHKFRRSSVVLCRGIFLLSFVLCHGDDCF